MPKYHLSDKLLAVRESMTAEEYTLFTQERADQYAASVYKLGFEEGRAKLLQEQRDERERRRIGRGKKQWVTVVYFIRSPTAIKIGMAKDAQRRLTVLQTSHPDELELVAVCEGGRELENEYHRRFRPFRVRGEWFAPHADILAEIERLNAHHPDTKEISDGC